MLLQFFQVSLHTAHRMHHREHYQYSPSVQSGKPTPQCQAVSAAFFCKWELTAVMPFSTIQWTIHHFPVFQLEPMSREQRPHSTICYLVATGFLHRVEPQTPLPAGYPANYANRIADHPVCGANCLAVSLCVHCSLNSGKASRELRGWRETEGPQELQAHLFSAGWHRLSLLAGLAAVAVDILSWLMQQPHNSLLPWLIQQTQPWHHSKTPSLWVELTYMCAAHNLWPCEYLVTCTCGAINDLCYYILIVYKTWAQRAWTHHPGQFCSLPARGK